MVIAIALKPIKPESDGSQDSMLEFEVVDDTYVETRESKSSLERKMTMKAFTESGIQATLYVVFTHLGQSLTSR